MLARQLDQTFPQLFPLRLCEDTKTRPPRSMPPTSRPAISFFVVAITTSILAFTVTVALPAKGSGRSCFKLAFTPTTVDLPGQKTGCNVYSPSLVVSL